MSTPTATPSPSRLWLYFQETHGMVLTASEESDIRHAANAAAESDIRTLETELTAACSLQALACRKLDAAETELAAAMKRIADCEFLLAHRAKIIERQEPRIKEAVARAERAEAEVEQLKADVSRETTVCDTACMEAQRLRDEVERLTKQNRDEESWWKEKHDYKARAERAEAALAFIASNGGTTHETECGPIACNGSWCAEQARAAIDAAMKGTP